MYTRSQKSWKKKEPSVDQRRVCDMIAPWCSKRRLRSGCPCASFDRASQVSSTEVDRDAVNAPSRDFSDLDKTHTSSRTEVSSRAHKVLRGDTLRPRLLPFSSDIHFLSSLVTVVSDTHAVERVRVLKCNSSGTRQKKQAASHAPAQKAAWRTLVNHR